MPPPCKEGVEKDARDELYEKVQCVNRYVIGQLILQEPVVFVLRKELRKMADGILVESEEVEKILRAGVLRGDVMAVDEPEVQNAVHRVTKFYRQAAKKCEKKHVEKGRATARSSPGGKAVPHRAAAKGSRIKRATGSSSDRSS